MKARMLRSIPKSQNNNSAKAENETQSVSESR